MCRMKCGSGWVGRPRALAVVLGLGELLGAGGAWAVPAEATSAHGALVRRMRTPERNDPGQQDFSRRLCATRCSVRTIVDWAASPRTHGAEEVRRVMHAHPLLRGIESDARGREIDTLLARPDLNRAYERLRTKGEAALFAHPATGALYATFGHHRAEQVPGLAHAMADPTWAHLMIASLANKHGALTATADQVYDGLGRSHQLQMIKRTDARFRLWRALEQAEDHSNADVAAITDPQRRASEEGALNDLVERVLSANGDASQGELVRAALWATHKLGLEAQYETTNAPGPGHWLPIEKAPEAIHPYWIYRTSALTGKLVDLLQRTFRGGPGQHPPALGPLEAAQATFERYYGGATAAYRGNNDVEGRRAEARASADNGSWLLNLIPDLELYELVQATRADIGRLVREAPDLYRLTAGNVNSPAQAVEAVWAALTTEP